MEMDSFVLETHRNGQVPVNGKKNPLNGFLLLISANENKRLQRSLLTKVELIPGEPSRKGGEIMLWPPMSRDNFHFCGFFFFFLSIFYLALLSPLGHNR